MQNGNADIVMDLASDQLSSLRSADGLTIDETASPTIFFLFANADASVSDVTSNPDFVEAVRYGLDYAGLLDLAGEGAVQAPGVIPDSFLGALVSRSGGRSRRRPRQGRPRPLRLRRCDGPARVPERPHRERARVRAARRAHRGQPRRGRHQDRTGSRPDGDHARELPRRQGADGPVAVEPGLPGPAGLPRVRPRGSSSVCAPAGPRAPPPTSRRWLSRRPPRVDDAERAPLYQQFQQQLNESGPFFPLFQPEAAVVSVTDRVSDAEFHPSLLLDVRRSRSRVIPAMSDDDRMRGHHRSSRSRRR